MRFLSSIIILLTITAFLWAADAPPSFTVTSQAPGNVVTTGTPLIFTVQGADGAVQYTVTDYFGKTVVTNSVTATNGMATITAPMLPPGFYTLDCTNGTQHVTVSLGVLINRGNAPLPRVGRIGTDAALTWLTSLENIPKIAHMVRLAGIPWVRERLAWRDIEQAQGAQTWTEKNPRYQAAADAYAREGVYVESMWHDAPDWTHQGLQGNAYGPDDLRTAYAFARDAASHYASAIQTWEIWNEPDIGFWKDLSDRFAGYEKATYLGIKAGDSKLQAFP
ncbi:MAG TPA: hypothetical protein VHV83_20050, partial [Armatimonadota bacterium]|nr:hypothetical protein [Armatimonadota bacterium]